MLQYPINVYPDNVSFDPTSDNYSRGFSFTFKGDELTAIYWRVYDYDSQELVLTSSIYNSGLEALAYNNEPLSYSGLFSTLGWNKSYLLQMMLCEVHVGHGTYITAYDHFVGRGTIIEGNAENYETVKIESGINTINEWNINGDYRNAISVHIQPTQIYSIDVNVAAVALRIDGVFYPIVSYNYVTGEATIENNSNNVIEDGANYELYSSYLVTESYYFQTTQDASIALSHVSSDAHGMNYTALYQQMFSKGLKYYTLDLYKKTSEETYIYIETTPKIYSQRIDYNFVDDYDFEGTGGNSETKQYKIVFNGVMQNGMTVTDEYEYQTIPRRIAAPIDSVSVSFEKSTNTPFIQWSDASQGSLLNKSVRVYRIDGAGLYNVGTSPFKLYRNPQDKKLIYDGSGSNGFNDYTASTHAKYKYMVVPYDDGTGDDINIYKALMTDEFEIDSYGYTITAIKDTNLDADNYPFYLIGDTWKFIADIEDTTMTQNTSKELHVGSGKYSTVTKTEVDYLSGTVSGMIGYLECNNNKYIDDIELVKAWRRFISQDCKFILRSQKGDVWLVNVIDMPTTAYQENNINFPTRFTFSWAECGDVNDILIGKHLPTHTSERR